MIKKTAKKKTYQVIADRTSQTLGNSCGPGEGSADVTDESGIQFAGILRLGQHADNTAHREDDEQTNHRVPKIRQSKQDENILTKF